MAIDRVNRDAVAAILVAYLRGETDCQATSKRLETILIERKNTPIDDKFLEDLVQFLGDGLERFWHWHQQSWWEQVRRELAFLKTDLEMRDIPLPPAERDTMPFVYWHLLALTTALAISWIVGWWVFVAVWVIAGTFGIVHLQFQHHGKTRDAEIARRTAFAPFLNEGEWLAHEKLLEPMQLPSYEEWRQKNPIETPRPPSLISTALFSACIVGVLACMYAGSVFLWPLHVVAFAISEFFLEKKSDTVQG
jgi:hypothetical protein